MLTLAALGFTLPVIAASLAVMLSLSLTFWFIMLTAFLAVTLLRFAGSAYLEKQFQPTGIGW